MGWNTYVNSREFDRDRLGLAYNFDLEFSDTMELIADVFYNDMDESQHGQQLFVNGNFGGRQVFRPYTVGTGQPSVLDSFDTEDSPAATTLSPASPATPMAFVAACSPCSAIPQALNTNLEFRFGKGEKFVGHDALGACGCGT